MAEIEFRKALNLALDEELARDLKVFIIGEEVAEYDGAYKVTKGLLAKYGPQRVVDAPISESGFCGLGIGAAMTGMRPVVEFMTFSFSLVAMDQILNTAAKLRYMSGGQIRLPITLRGPSGVVHQLGATHSNSLESIFAHTPGLKVVACSTPENAKGLLKSAIRDDDPVIFLESELLYSMKGEVPDDPEFLLPLHKGRVAREGADVTIVAYSKRVHQALAAADMLAREGIKAEVIDLISLRPIDQDLILKSFRKTNRMVTVEESWSFCGIGASIVDIVQRYAFDHMDAPIERVTLEEVPMAYNEALENFAQPSPEKIVCAVRRTLYKETEAAHGR